MYVAETQEGKWFCSESKKEIKAVSESCKNLWYQPFNYLSGAMSDFFWTIRDGKQLDKEVQMRLWGKELPLSKCIEGDVTFLGKKEPKWYRLITGIEVMRLRGERRYLKYRREQFKLLREGGISFETVRFIHKDLPWVVVYVSKQDINKANKVLIKNIFN